MTDFSAFDYTNDAAFLASVAKNKRIDFLVRGSISCDAHLIFKVFDVRIEIFPGLSHLKAIIEGESGSFDYPLREIHQDTVFPGQMFLEKTGREDIRRSLDLLEFWADSVCLTQNLAKLIVEINEVKELNVAPNRTVIGKQEFALWKKSFAGYANLKAHERKIVSRAMWWFRNGCNAQYRSLFDAYTAFWNALEILCKVKPRKLNDGEDVQKKIEVYFQDKISLKPDNSIEFQIKPQHIAECFDRIVNQSIRTQIEISLKKLIKEEDVFNHYIRECFGPERGLEPDFDYENTLYGIRNQINHGSIQENAPDEQIRIQPRAQLLSFLVWRLLRVMLGQPPSPAYPRFEEPS